MARVRAMLAAAMLVVAAAGCAKIATPGKSPLVSPDMSTDSVALEITTLRFPLGDPELNGPLWTDIDEQQWPIELRRQLSANGIRIGVIGTRLPSRLEQMLHQQEPRDSKEPKPSATGDANVVDFQRESVVHGRLLRMGAGRRMHFICTGETTRHPELSILVRGENGEVHGRTYPKVMGFLSIRSFPQGDGQVRVELTPAIEYGDPQRQYDPSAGVLKMEFRPPQEMFENLRTESTLSPGQMLIVTVSPDRPGSLGHHFFTERTSHSTQQKILLIRLAQAQYDELFSAEAPPTIRDE